MAAAALIVLPVVTHCDSVGDEVLFEGPTTTVQTGGPGSFTTTGVGGADAAPPPPCNAEPFEPGVYNPDAACWVPVTWPSPCNDLEMAVDPTMGAPPFQWVPCAPGSPPGCSQLVEQPIFVQKSQATKGSIVRTSLGYRIGLVQQLADTDGFVAAVYDETGTAMVAWRTSQCVVRPPELTLNRVWVGAGAVDENGYLRSSYIAAPWSELMTITSNIQLAQSPQHLSAGSDISAAWLLGGRSIQIEDLSTGKLFLYGGSAGTGNPDYAYPHAVHNHVVALTAPNGSGYAAAAVWDRSSGSMVDVVTPPAPNHVADVNSDGATLVWIVVPALDAPGQLWTSPFAPTPSGLSPALRRTTPPVRNHLTAAWRGYYAMWSPQLFNQNGPGDNRIHVYRLSDAQHWSFDYAEGLLAAHLIYHVDESVVFYSGYGPITRQRLDALGPGDPP